MNSRSTHFYPSLESKGSKTIRLLIGGLAAISALFFGFITFFVVPAPNNQTATEVSGILVSMSHPHPEYGDIGIVLDNGQRYYINRANEIVHLDWEKMLAEVRPGDEIQLTIATPLIWRLLGDDTKTSQPVAGLRTADTIYMDADISAATWTSQGQFSGIALLSLCVLLLCLLPDLFRLFNRRSPLGV